MALCRLLGKTRRQCFLADWEAAGRIAYRHWGGVDRHPNVGQHSLNFPPGNRRMSTWRPLNFLPQSTQTLWSSSEFQLLKESPTRKIESRSSRLRWAIICNEQSAHCNRDTQSECRL